MSGTWPAAALASAHLALMPDPACDLLSRSIGWPARGQPALFVYIPGESAVCEPGLASQRVLNGAETNYAALMSLFHISGVPRFFPSPDRMAVSVNVSVFVMGLMRCGWHSQANSILRAGSLHLQPCSDTPERAIMRILHT